MTEALTMFAEIIARALGGRKAGSGWIACCPAHNDRHPSLSICDSNGGVLVYCHAGCDQTQVIAALRSLGLWQQRWHAHHQQPRQIATDPPDHNGAKRTEAALTIWQAVKSAQGTLAETYLRSRGLHIPTPQTLRFHARLKHPSGGIWPAMVALVTRGTDAKPIAIHRTFLARNGNGKASVDPAKMMLGPCRGGVVRLAEPGDVLMVGEGIETCLAAMQATGNPAWASLGTSGLRTLDLPAEVRDVIVIADGDDPGETAARDCALRWKQQGRRVRIARSPRGFDFNDLLMGRAPRIEKNGI